MHNLQQKQKISNEGIDSFNKFIRENNFTVTEKEFPARYARAALNTASPSALRAPIDMYIRILSSKDATLSLTLYEMQILIQILPQATGKGMAMTPDEYGKYLTKLQALSERWGKEWNALIDEYIQKYPAPDEIEVTEIDTTSKTVAFPAAQA